MKLSKGQYYILKKQKIYTGILCTVQQIALTTWLKEIILKGKASVFNNMFMIEFLYATLLTLIWLCQ